MNTIGRAGDTTTLTATDGHELDAYRVEPEGPARGAIVVVQEIFGVTDHIRDVCDRFAALGYTAIAPAMFDRVRRGVELGYSEETVAEALSIRRQLTDWNLCLADVEAARAAVADAGKVACVGYCFGGDTAWIGVARGGFDAAVAYYGGHIYSLVDETPKAPIILHYGTEDHIATPDKIALIRERHPDVPVYVYEGAKHGFNCDARTDYQEAAAVSALERTKAFLAEHIG
jgi:carboxymethylenebutenolidase